MSILLKVATQKEASFMDKVKTVGKNLAKGPRHLAENAALASAKGQMASGKKLSPKLKKRVAEIGKKRKLGGK